MGLSLVNIDFDGTSIGGLLFCRKEAFYAETEKIQTHRF